MSQKLLNMYIEDQLPPFTLIGFIKAKKGFIPVNEAGKIVYDLDQTLDVLDTLIAKSKPTKSGKGYIYSINKNISLYLSDYSYQRFITQKIDAFPVKILVSTDAELKKYQE